MLFHPACFHCNRMNGAYFMKFQQFLCNLMISLMIWLDDFHFYLIQWLFFFSNYTFDHKVLICQSRQTEQSQFCDWLSYQARDNHITGSLKQNISANMVKNSLSSSLTTRRSEFNHHLLMWLMERTRTASNRTSWDGLVRHSLQGQGSFLAV